MTWRNPNWTLEKKQWFMKLVESKCTKPDIANILTHYGRFDLEVEIVVAPEDESAFTDEVMIDLMKKVAKEVDVMKPIIYLSGKPTRDIAEAIRSKDMEL